MRCDMKKRPVDHEGVPMTWTHPDTWLSYTQVTHSSYGAGAGFVLGKGIGVIDLDYCIRSDGSLTPLARKVLEDNPHAWVERSQSRQGLHVWGLLDGDVHIHESGYEVYAGDAKRFIWVTGDVFRGGSLHPLVLSQ